MPSSAKLSFLAFCYYRQGVILLHHQQSSIKNILWIYFSWAGLEDLAYKNLMLFTEKIFCLPTMKDERDGCDDDEDDDILMNLCWI